MTEFYVISDRIEGFWLCMFYWVEVCHNYNLISFKINVGVEYKFEMVGNMRLETMEDISECIYGMEQSW